MLSTIYLYRTIWRHILFPSRHKPDGNGLTWPQIQYKYDRKKDLLRLLWRKLSVGKCD